MSSSDFDECICKVCIRIGIGKRAKIIAVRILALYDMRSTYLKFLKSWKTQAMVDLSCGFIVLLWACLVLDLSFKMS